MRFWSEKTDRSRRKNRPQNKKPFALMGYLTGWSGEERPDAQVDRLTTHSLSHTHTLTHVQYWSHCSALKGIIVYLALKSMGPSTDR